MTESTLKFNVGNNGTHPTKAYTQDAGFDLYAAEDAFIPHGETRIISTDLSVSLQEGTFGLIAERSSMGAKGVSVGGGVIDQGYTGELKVILHNITSKSFVDPVLLTRGFKIKKGDKIAQLLVLPNMFAQAQNPNNSRGSGGFGSSDGQK